MNTIAQKLEALLFTAGEAVPFSELQELTGATEKETADAMQELSDELRNQGISVVTTETHAELVTSPVVSEFLAQFNKEESDQLSKAALETLSVIAYRGPVTRFDVDAIRGVDSRHMIRQLFARGLVRQLRLSGKAPQYDVTEEFLSHLGITNKKELPDFETLRTNEHLTRILDAVS
jgi:segregation and condensation protein B